MTGSPLEKLTAVRLALGRGVYLRDGVAFRTCVAQTLLGLRTVSEDFDDLSLVDAVSDKVRHLLQGVLRRKGSAATPTEEVEGGDAGGEYESNEHEQPLVVGLPESAITFSSAIESDQPTSALPVNGDRDSGKQSNKGAQSILTASQVIAYGKSSIRVSARVRAEEIQKVRDSLNLGSMEDHVFEPAPWAAWRASVHHAALKPRRGLHLRYLLGEDRGLAFLATPKGPIAWQVLSWEEGEFVESLLQAYSLLAVHAGRRLAIGEIRQISVQGVIDPEHEKSLSDQLGLPVSKVDGPEYTPELISFGLALGALEGEGNTLNLGGSLKEPPGLWKRVPWADVIMLCLAFVGMYATLQYYRDDMSQQLATATHQNASVEWAANLTQVQLNQEFAALQRQVSPLQKFVDRRLRFSSSLAAIAGELPANTWLVNVTGEDLAWEKNPNKALGERYVLLQIGAPAERRGDVPPEVNATVASLVDNEYLGGTLPKIKLADVMWQERGGEGHSVFSILALPKK